jgi:hypothetical protein
MLQGAKWTFSQAALSIAVTDLAPRIGSMFSVDPELLAPTPIPSNDRREQKRGIDYDAQ